MIHCDEKLVWFYSGLPGKTGDVMRTIHGHTQTNTIAPIKDVAMTTKGKNGVCIFAK